MYGTYQGTRDINSALSHLFAGLEIVETYKVMKLKMANDDGQIIQFYLAELGYIYLEKNQLDSALIYTQKAIDQNHTVNGTAWNYPIYLLGNIQRQKGNYEQALVFVVQSNNPNRQSLNYFEAVNNLAEVYK